MQVGRPELQALRAKYGEMLEMRRLHAAGLDDEGPAVRARMAELAVAFPGALREVDDLELVEIERRIEALDAVLEHGIELEPWMEAVALFHALARGALSAKRWLRGRKAVSAEVARRFAAELESLPFPEDARRWVADLALVASPPGGRLSALVLVRVAGALQVSEAVVRRLVFGWPRRLRRTH